MYIVITRIYDNFIDDIVIKKYVVNEIGYQYLKKNYKYEILEIIRL